MTISTALVSGLDAPLGVAVSGGRLFVANYFGNSIGEYTTNGATVNASLVSGLNNPQGLAVSGGDLFVSNVGSDTIGEFTTNGVTVNASLVTGLGVPVGIAVVPEPTTLALVAFSGLALLWFPRRHS